ncbi:uncharacterized protein M437DRAFT_70397 [Aureobasidium melanogenum CBS 110374]|uniref:Uncharacterized protein n=1 Tax=Aureobasidium melanogenum (strain CBS 110374) TaxID=1043003 RepID=A0A074W5T9_AURM1|nr:uncharacterized protein M437DRAFT_70397 [Aureobasidium melanogenum CBS 110374]KEQ57936.1 hypothetical protein M437DRAFT_70397 [Aureobasidium melanogenum CBS 110374]
MAPTSDHADSGSRYRTRRTLQLHRDNATDLGASRSRSRSRSGRIPARISSIPLSSRQRGRSIFCRAYPFALSKQTILVMLLALVNILLSWFGPGVFSYPGPLVRSIAKQVWTPSDSNMAEVRHDLCQVPLVPRVLHCDELTEKEKLSRLNSIENVIPSIAFALSENPDAVDSIFDLLEDIRNELALMRHDIEVIESAELNAPIPIRSKETQSTMVTVRLLNATAVRFQSDLVGYDAFRDWLLENMYLRLRALDPQLVYDADQMVDPDYTDEDTSSRPLLTTVSDDLSHFIAVLERIEHVNRSGPAAVVAQTIHTLVLALKRFPPPRKKRRINQKAQRQRKKTAQGTPASQNPGRSSSPPGHSRFSFKSTRGGKNCLFPCET